MGEGADQGETQIDRKYEQKLGGGNEHDISGACEKTGPRGSCWQTVGNESRSIDWDQIAEAGAQEDSSYGQWRSVVAF